MSLFLSISYHQHHIKNSSLSVLIGLQYVKFETVCLTNLKNKISTAIFIQFGLQNDIFYKNVQEILIKVTESHYVNKRIGKNELITEDKG